MTWLNISTYLLLNGNGSSLLRHIAIYNLELENFVGNSYYLIEISS
jgi:hypothetical protein